MAVTVAITDVEPAVVEMLKLAEVCPAGTVTLAGTVSCELLLCSVTTSPPVGAGAFRLTVPVRDAPPVTEDDETVSVETQAAPPPAGFIVT